jgi:hypothetical protein
VERILVLPYKMLTNDGDAIVLFKHAQIKDNQGDHEGCLRDSLKFLEYATRTGNKKWESVACQNIGIQYNTVGKHEDAAEFHLKHLEIAVERGDDIGIKEANENIRMCEQILLGNETEEIEQMSAKILRREQAMKLFRDAQVRDNKGDFEGSKQLLLQFLEYANVTNNRLWAGIAYQNIGIALNTIEKHDEAMHYHLLHLAVATELGDVTGQNEANANIDMCRRLISGECEKIMAPPTTTLAEQQQLEKAKLDSLALKKRQLKEQKDFALFQNLFAESTGEIATKKKHEIEDLLIHSNSLILKYSRMFQNNKDRNVESTIEYVSSKQGDKLFLVYFNVAIKKIIEDEAVYFVEIEQLINICEKSVKKTKNLLEMEKYKLLEQQHRKTMLNNFITDVEDGSTLNPLYSNLNPLYISKKK